MPTRAQQVNSSVAHRQTYARIKAALERALDESPLSRNEVCARAGVNPSQLSRYFARDDRGMHLDLIDDIANVLGVSIPEMIAPASMSDVSIPAISWRRLPPEAKASEAMAEAARIASKRMFAPGAPKGSIAISVDEPMPGLEKGSVLIANPESRPMPGDIAIAKDGEVYKLGTVASFDGKIVVVCSGIALELSKFCTIISSVVRFLAG